MSNCHCNTGINLDGSGQLGRYLKALDPSYAPINGQSIEDLLLFAKRYAGQIRFYDIPESHINDGIKPGKVSWREFFRRDMAVIAASVSVLDISSIKKEYDELRERLDADPSPEKFAALFTISIGMATRIDRWYSVAIPENPLRTDLDLAIDSHLRWQMKRIMAYEDGYKFIDSKNPLNIDYSGIENDQLWGLKDPVDPDAGIYMGNTLDDKIRNAALYADDIFNDFFSTLQSFIDNGPSYMAFALEQYPAHQPHMALFIAFLQIFKLAQEQMNGLTGKMLDFYYKEVLQLTPKDSIPDKTHVIFELAKDIAQYDLATGTALSAGKDATGKEQVYKTAADLVLNQAKVKELKTIFIEKADAKALAINKTLQNIYASPVANSADGYGLAFTEPNGKWPTFGKGLSKESKTKNPCRELDVLKENLLSVLPVKTGFAIASPRLVLQGGKRLVALKVPGIKGLMSNKSKNPFSIWLTGEKEWLKVDTKMSEAEKIIFTKFFKEELDLFNHEDNTIGTSYFLDIEKDTFYVYLPVAEKPIIAFDAKLHTGYNYKTAYPIMQVMLNEDMDIDELVYKNIKADNLSVDVRVGSVNPNEQIRKEKEKLLKANIPLYHFDGLETVIIQTAEGVFPPGEPFNPFTSYPGLGKSLFIGSGEVFNKPLDKLAVNIKRTQQREQQSEAVPDNVVSDNDAAPVLKKIAPDGAAASSKENMLLNKASVNRPFGVSVLTNKNWKPLTDDTGNDFNQPGLTENILNEVTNIAGGPPTSLVRLSGTPVEPVTKWGTQVNKGFIRIDLLIDIPGKDNQTTTQVSQEIAPMLEIKQLSLSYHSQFAKLDSETDQFFHVYPFGVVETYLGNAAANIKNRRAAKAGTSGFAALDQLKDNLLVDAGNLLLPQYTFLDGYSSYNIAEQKSTQGELSYLKASAENNVLNELVKATSNISKIQGGGNNQYSAGFEEEGMLFIGLEKAVPLQSLSLLFQFAEGSADDEDKDPPPIRWSYLTNNEWRPMRAEDVVSDGTYGFQTTGIVKLNIPADATSNNTIISGGLHWLCISVYENAHRIPKLINVVAQAAEVIFEDNDNDQQHFDSALPAGSITKLFVKVAQVSKVEQPFASFDGKHKEISKEFYTRVSERLRHKNRAINSWDYEHLVLNRFPSVYKVKCITATDPNCLCREGAAVAAVATENKRNYKVEIAGAERLDPERVDPTEEGVKNIEAAIDDLASNPKATLVITLYAKTAAEKKFVDEIAVNIKQNIKKNFSKVKIAEDRMSVVIAKSGGAVNIVDMDVISAAEKTIAGEAVCCGPQIAPGHVLLVPIANLKNRNSINPLQPKTSRRILVEIENYLKKLTSPFVKVHAKNPVYEQVIVGFKVQFYTGTDKGFYLKKLNEEIVEYLTPWAFSENADVQFGQKIYASSIINFIEERPYVDFITDFVMGVCKDECCTEKKPELTESIENNARENLGLRDYMPMSEEAGKDAAMPAGSGANLGNAASKLTKIGGVVVDEKTQSPLAGATVSLKGTSTGVQTDMNGKFLLEADPATALLTVSYIGYKMAQVQAAGQTDIKIQMSQGQAGLEEVVVIGYGTQNSIPEMIAGLCGCDDVEKIMAGNTRVKGEIVAAPSTARSILVSVPQHLIIPYTAPAKQTPCEERKEKQNKKATVPSALPSAEIQPPPQVADSAKEKLKDTVKVDIQPAKDKLKEEVAAEPAKPVKDLKDAKIPDLIKPATELIIKAEEVKKSGDAIKEELVKGNIKVADAITAKPVMDNAAKAAGIVATDLTEIKALPIEEAAGLIKKKAAKPAKAVTTKSAKPVIKIKKAAATIKPKKNNK